MTPSRFQNARYIGHRTLAGGLSLFPAEQIFGHHLQHEILLQALGHILLTTDILDRFYSFSLRDDPVSGRHRC